MQTRRDRPPPRRRGGWAALVVVVLATAAMLGGATGPASAGQAEPSVAQGDEVVLWYFWGDGCPYCELAADWLVELEATHPDVTVRQLEVWHDPGNQQRFVEMMQARGTEASGVPAFILDDEVWVGFSDGIAAEIEDALDLRLDTVEPSPDPEPGVEPASRNSLDLGPLGVVDVSAQPMVAATMMIAFVDGFNPCSLWVLTVLLAMILHTQSRLRIAAVGVTFLTVTAAIYGLFIAGLFAAFAVAGQLTRLHIAVAVLALGFAAVSIKDYFAYKQGLSFSIPDRFKPRIYRGGRAIRQDRPLPIVLAMTVALAAGVALIELPCTAGFPVIWSNLVTETGVSGAGFLGLLGVYLAIYLAVEVVILAGALVTMRATRLQEVHGRTLKLIGGAVMAALALVLLVDPSIMERLTGSFFVIGGALAVAGVVMLVDRRVRGARTGAAS